MKTHQSTEIYFEKFKKATHYRVVINRKCVSLRHYAEENKGKKAVVAIDHGFAWDNAEEELQPGDFILWEGGDPKEGTLLDWQWGKPVTIQGHDYTLTWGECENCGENPKYPDWVTKCKCGTERVPKVTFK